MEPAVDGPRFQKIWLVIKPDFQIRMAARSLKYCFAVHMEHSVESVHQNLYFDSAVGSIKQSCKGIVGTLTLPYIEGGDDDAFFCFLEHGESCIQSTSVRLDDPGSFPAGT